MNNDLKTEIVVVITGAASGIGLALAEQCLKKGMSVVMADKNVQALEEQTAVLNDSFSGKVYSLACDVTQLEQVQALASFVQSELGHLNFLFNNAGISGPFAPVWQLSQSEFQAVMDVNVLGVFNGIKAFMPYLLSQAQQAHIVNMASVYGWCSGSNMAAYTMSKHAVVALTESLYFDLQQTSSYIDVSVVCPSFVSTNLIKNTYSEHHSPIQQQLSDLIARSRPAEDIASYILSEIEKGAFYILPDKEIKDYVGQRAQALIDQKVPHAHSLEKVMQSLCRRVGR